MEIRTGTTNKGDKTVGDKEKMEQNLLKSLTEGEMETSDPERAAVKRLPPKHEVRIRTEYNPIVKETKIVRKTVKEIDGRYDHIE